MSLLKNKFSESSHKLAYNICMEDLFELATKHFYNQEYEEALRLYYQILSDNLDDNKAYYNVALTYDLMGEIELAIAYYNKAMKINENDVRSINNLAKIYYERLNLEEQACELLNKAIKIAPMDAESYNTYGNIYFNKKDYKTAKLYFQKSINFDKNYFKNYYDIAKAYIGLDEFDKAKKMLNACLKLKPEFMLAQELLSKL